MPIRTDSITGERRDTELEECPPSCLVRKDTYSGIVEISGGDALDFLHRMSTNNVLDLASFHHVTTVLITEKARLLDVLTIVRLPDRILMFTRADADPRNVISWLEKFVIMDDVSFTDRSTILGTISLIASGNGEVAKGTELMQQLGEGVSGPKPPVITSFLDDLWKGRKLDIVFERSSYANDPLPELPGVHCSPMSDQVYEATRIRLGVPAFPNELSEKVNPLEAGLRRFVSFTKGCYIGQEVVARLDTYGKVQRSLTHLSAEDPDVPILPGAIVSDGRSEVGWVTSSLHSIGSQESLALGYVKLKSPGPLSVRNVDETHSTVTLREIPE